jgi:hypothetical protein
MKNSQKILSVFFSVTLALFLVIFLNNKQILSLFILLGQGHFLISYFYQYKSGKMDSSFRKKFLYLFIPITVVCAYVYGYKEYVNHLALFTSVFFVLHYYNDEIKIQNIQRYSFLKLGALLSMLSFTGLYLNKLFGLMGLVISGWGLAACTIFIFFCYLSIQESGEELGTWNYLYILFFTFLNCTIPIALTYVEKVSAYQIFGFIIFFHYIRWYIYYGLILKSNKESFNEYLKTVFNINFLLIALSVQSLTLQNVFQKYGTYLIFIFNPIFFYGWTIIHIALSIRKTDFN